MPRKPLIWKLFPVYFSIALLSVLVFGLYASKALREFYQGEVESDLEVRTELVREDLECAMADLDSDGLEPLIKSLAKTSRTRLTVIAPDGVVMADSEHNPLRMENHADRPEVKRALEGKVGRARRVSPTLDITMVYIGVPIRDGGEITAVLRSAVGATALDAVPKITFQRMLLGALLIAVLAATASLLAVRTISRPLLRLREAAARFANGDFRGRVPVTDTEEFAGLADTLNRMAAQLDRQVRTITRQASEQHAILSSMKEAVIAIDTDDRILILNPTAEQLLGTSLDSVKGKTIQEAIRNPDLQRFFEGAHDAVMPSEEIIFRGFEDKTMQAIGSALMDSEGNRIGVLVVLNDITQTRKLENVRKDFVANVSHELKTPITSIKGFVETLREGAIDDPRKSREFLGIVSRQAERLHAIIEDLLALSAIEQKAESADIYMERSKLLDVLQAAVMNCQSNAREHEVTTAVDCPDDLTVVANAPLLEQAITNLVDNAIKYSPGGNVRVSGGMEDGEVAIHVTDTGPGIEPEHIPRLFERFYRIDKARSRKQGGTGLGLAIVKHIVQAHHGRIEVQSTPGKGSTFSVYLPVGGGPEH